jgi:hypothetical protein
LNELSDLLQATMARTATLRELPAPRKRKPKREKPPEPKERQEPAPSLLRSARRRVQALFAKAAAAAAGTEAAARDGASEAKRSEKKAGRT